MGMGQRVNPHTIRTHVLGNFEKNYHEDAMKKMTEEEIIEYKKLIYIPIVKENVELIDFNKINTDKNNEIKQDKILIKK